MWKYSLLTVFLFTGCSNFEFNFAMCDNIGSEQNPEMIEKCRNYNEEEAQKAFDNTKHKSSTKKEDVIEFKK
jgi:hypothetical protein